MPASLHEPIGNCLYGAPVQRIFNVSKTDRGGWNGLNLRLSIVNRRRLTGFERIEYTTRHRAFGLNFAFEDFKLGSTGVEQCDGESRADVLHFGRGCNR